MGASGNCLSVVGRVTSRGAFPHQLATSGDVAYKKRRFPEVP